MIRRYWPFLALAAVSGVLWAAVALAWGTDTAKLWTIVISSLALLADLSRGEGEIPPVVFTRQQVAEVCEHFAPGCHVITCENDPFNVTVRVGWRAFVPFYARALERQLVSTLRLRGPHGARFVVEVRR